MGCSIAGLRPLEGGRSSRTYVAATEGAPPGHELVVLKVAPAGLLPVRNRDVLRQARVLRSLEAVPGVRVPRVLFDDPGEPPETPPLFAMTFVDGESFEPRMDSTERPRTPADIDARARSAAAMLAALHAVRPEDVGLGDETETGLEEEIERWVRAFATVDEELRPGAGSCAEDLRRAMPAAVPSVLVHGDFRLGNMLCRGPEVLAVIDWEIWTRGDPRVDLTWFLLMAEPDVHPSAVRDAPGMPRAPELLAAYERAGGAEVADLGWFEAHTLFKAAAVTALIVKHNRKRAIDDDFTDRAAKHIPVMIDRARAMLG